MDPYRIRASSIAAIIDCPLRGLSIALGLVKPLPSTAPAAIGTACHEGTAAFDRARLEGTPITPDDAAEIVMDLVWMPGEEVDWSGVTQEQAEARALGVHTRYCVDIAPTIEYEAVELTLEPLVVDVAGISIELTGTLDRVYKQESKRGILDIKTGARVMSQNPGKHKGQLATYEILYEHTAKQSIELPGVIGQLQTSADYDVSLRPVENARDALVGNDYTPGYLYFIAQMIKTGDFYGNPSSSLCSKKYCPLYKECIYR